MAYTARLDRANINSMPRFMLISECGMGSGIHIIRAKVKAKVGAIINKMGDEVRGCNGSLVNNFTASAIGCNRP